MPDSQTSIAGSRVTSSSRSSNEPSARRRKSLFWRIIRREEPTPSSEVANQSCQTSVMRSTNGCVRADHAIEPPEVVVSPGVRRRQGMPVVVPRRRSLQPLAVRARERLDRRPQALAGELLRLTGTRAEAGAPEQALGLPRGRTGRDRSATRGARRRPRLRRCLRAAVAPTTAGGAHAASRGRAGPCPRGPRTASGTAARRGPRPTAARSRTWSPRSMSVMPV